MFVTARKLHRLGILGINKRNACYMMEYNDRRDYPRVDDKLITKQLAQEKDFSVPPLYGVVDSLGQLSGLHEILKNYSDFVIKPAKGSGGKGVVVISGRMKHMYRKISGMAITEEELEYHVSNILSGMYSFGGSLDKAIIEYRVKFDPVFDQISYLGVPDIRIIIFFGIPVMAMIRLPTRMSDGKANLHQGAVGAGIDIATGITLRGVWKNFIVSEHPDTGQSIVGVQIPNWAELLKLASSCYELTGLGYQGVDIVLDKDKGPLLLELNARPGLNIQIANQAGLESRLKCIEEKGRGISDLLERIAFAQTNFCN